MYLFYLVVQLNRKIERNKTLYQNPDKIRISLETIRHNYYYLRYKME